MSTDDSTIAAAAPSAKADISSSAGSSGSLRSVIDSIIGTTPLGETDVGKSWCLKALHPADTNVLCAPMPVNETRSFASVAFTQMDVHSCPGTFDPAKVWNMKIYVHRDPVLLYSWVKSQSGAADVIGYTFSRQYNGATSTYDDMFAAVRTNMEKFRISSHSLTAYFDGASESDQGHVVCGQTELPRLPVPSTYVPVDPTKVSAQLPFVYYQDPLPSFTDILQTTRCYQGHAKDGIYAPSKLQNLGRWVYTNRVSMMLGSQTAAADPFGALGFTASSAEATAASFYSTFPYMTVLPADGFKNVFDQVDTSLTTIVFNNMASTSSIRATMRWTMDMMVRPATLYAPFVRMPPIEDHMALRMFAEVSRRLADGYPSSYNNLAMLLPIIGRVASQVLPLIAPGVAKWVASKAARRVAFQRKGWIPEALSLGESLGRELTSQAVDGAQTSTSPSGQALSNLQSVISPVIDSLGQRQETQSVPATLAPTTDIPFEIRAPRRRFIRSRSLYPRVYTKRRRGYTLFGRSVKRRLF